MDYQHQGKLFRCSYYAYLLCYVGNAVGDTGDQAGNAIVDATDEINCRNNARHFIDPAGIDDWRDHDRDGKVDATDQIIARNNTTTMATALHMLVAP